jgi:low affinity Fe/Cu permease
MSTSPTDSGSGDDSGRAEGESTGLDSFFSRFSTRVAHWTGSHWTFAIAAALVVLSLLFTSVETTNIAISIVTLLMVFVLQNTQNRDSAALHLKMDEIVRAVPEARDDVRGVESRPKAEIEELNDGEVAATLERGT